MSANAVSDRQPGRDAVDDPLRDNDGSQQRRGVVLAKTFDSATTTAMEKPTKASSTPVAVAVPPPEACNGRDDNHDGRTDEDAQYGGVPLCGGAVSSPVGPVSAHQVRPA